MNLSVQSMYELCAEWAFVFAQGKLMAYSKTTQYEENISLKNSLQVWWFFIS
jgi:hypothetical protein